MDSNWSLQKLLHLTLRAKLNSYSGSSENLYPRSSLNSIRIRFRSLRHPCLRHRTPRSGISSCHTHLCLLREQLIDRPPSLQLLISMPPRLLMHLSSSQAGLRTVARSTSSSGLLGHSSGLISAAPPSYVELLYLLVIHLYQGVSSICQSHLPLTSQIATWILY